MEAAGPGGFDLSALSSVLNDPSIRGMAEQIASDPAFAQMTQALQSSLVGGNAGAPGVDPSKYAEAMGSVLQNPNFMSMAERLGQQIMQQDPRMATMMQSMQDPGTQAALEARLTALKDDPELAPIMAEVEAGGPAAMMKYWDNPVVLEKLSKAMGSAFDAPALGGGLGGVVPDINGDLGEGEEGEEGEEEEGEEEEEEGEPTVHSAASSGNVEQLKSLLDGGANADEADDEGRTPLHFSSGYGEVEVVKILLAASASVDAVDHNDNTPLHYAAGYGQPDCVALLIDAGADRDAKNKDGKTAQEVAELNGQDASVSLLAAAGAGGAAAEGGAEGGDA